MTDTPPTDVARASAAPRRATWRFMGAHPLRQIALGFGSGLSPVAPGTAGTLAGWALYLLIDRFAAPSHAAWGAILVAGFFVGWWACTSTARAMAVADPSAVVWDEIIAFWIILWCVMPVGLLGQAVAFGLFRLFDAVKRGPVGWADSLFKPKRGELPGWPQGFGIIFDDLIAAVCVLAVWFALGLLPSDPLQLHPDRSQAPLRIVPASR